MPSLADEGTSAGSISALPTSPSLAYNGNSASSICTLLTSPSLADEHPDQPSCSVNCLKVTAEESGIHTIPLVTLQQIWSKANSLLQGDNTITPVPGTDKQANVVISYSSDTPYVLSGQKVIPTTFVILTAHNGFLANFVLILLL